MATGQERLFKRRGKRSTSAPFSRFSNTWSVLGKPSTKALSTACSDGPLAKSRQAANSEQVRAAARNTMLQTTSLVHSQPWSFIRIESTNQLNAHR